MASRALARIIRHFLWRFLEHDLISPSADRHVVLSALVGTVVAVSLFVAVLIASPYQFFPTMPPGTTSIRSLDDRFLFTSASMLVTALMAVAQWDALALDPRDTSVLGVLPIPRAVIVRTKFMAVALLAIGVAIAWNLVPTLLRWVAMPSKIGVTVDGALKLTLAHGVTTMAAGVFGFLAVLGLREGTSAIVGQARFQRISTTLQAALVVALVTALFLLPGANGNVARKWMAHGGPPARALSPLWFVGLNEALAGSVVDTLPRAQLSRFLVVAERNATDLYRSLWPLYRELAWRAIAALVIVGIATTAACLWNSRRLPMLIVRRAHDGGAGGRAWKWMVAHVVARTPLRAGGLLLHAADPLETGFSSRRAGIVLGRWTLADTHHSARASTWSRGGVVSDPWRSSRQSLLLASVLGGFRHAVRIPAELRASTTFSLAWAGNLAPYIRGVKLAGWIALVLPTLGGLFIWHAVVLGAGLAALHLGVGVAVGLLTMDAVFFHNRACPLRASTFRVRTPRPPACCIVPGCSRRRSRWRLWKEHRFTIRDSTSDCSQRCWASARALDDSTESLQGRQLSSMWTSSPQCRRSDSA